MIKRKYLLDIVQLLFFITLIEEVLTIYCFRLRDLYFWFIGYAAKYLLLFNFYLIRLIICEVIQKPGFFRLHPKKKYKFYGSMQ